MSAPFRARRRLTGYQLVATDTRWRVGSGQPVEGPMAALLLLLTGRPAALTQLSGAGAADLAATFPAGAAPTAADGTVPIADASTAPSFIDLTLDRLRGEGIHGNRSV
jgi:hypothetical protein